MSLIIQCSSIISCKITVLRSTDLSLYQSSLAPRTPIDRDPFEPQILDNPEIYTPSNLFEKPIAHKALFSRQHSALRQYAYSLWLSNEILLHIIDNVDIDDIETFSSCCKFLDILGGTRRRRCKHKRAQYSSIVLRDMNRSSWSDESKGFIQFCAWGNYFWMSRIRCIQGSCTLARSRTTNWTIRLTLMKTRKPSL